MHRVDTRPTSPWTRYRSETTFDEMVAPDGQPRPGCGGLFEHVGALGEDLYARQEAAQRAIRSMGITFTVYSEEGNIDRAWPFDVIPRIITLSEWTRITAGLTQRLAALNMFIDDVYGAQRCLSEGFVPAELVLGSPNYRPECRGVSPAQGVWAHICGSDLVRGADGRMLVLEDNLRVPSGVSYMLENRTVSKRVFADVFRDLDIHPVDDYPLALATQLQSLSPRPGEQAVVVVLTPGVHNSAYFEHAFLAQQMGAQLVEGPDLLVADDDCCYLRAVEGLVRVDVIYRRVDDLFLDPAEFRPDSALGVRGLMRAWRAGNVSLVNAPGAGVADDKAVYAYVPTMIRRYLGEEPLIDNVETYLCDDPGQRSHVLANLAQLVVKPANESGGYGVFIGPQASIDECAAMRRQIDAEPRNWVAQPVVQLSTVPTLDGTDVVPRHVDLRPFIISGQHPYVTSGGLTRVALRPGSLVVNSSRGGGSKDTWIITDGPG